MGRPAGALNEPDKAAQRILSDKQFARGIKLQRGQLETLDAIARGEYRPRNVSAVLAGIRTKLEWGHARPEQRHELSGSVTITVECAIPTRASQQAKVLPDATEQPQVLSLQQGPITAHMSTEISAEDQDILPSHDDTSTELVHEDGRLRADPTVALTAEERRAQARDEWQAEQAALRGEAT